MKKYIISALVGLSLALTVLFLFLGFDLETVDKSASNGILDIRGLDTSSEVISVIGGWEHFDRVFLCSPESIAADADSSEAIFGSYRITVISKPMSSITLCGYSVGLSSKAYVNGIKAAEIGRVSSLSSELEPRLGLMIIPIFTDESGKAEIVIEYASTENLGKNEIKTMLISDPSTIKELLRRNEIRSIAHSGSLLAFVLYFALCAVCCRQSQYAFLSLCCLTFAIRDRNFFLVYLLPSDYDYYSALRVMSITTSVQLPLLLMLLSSLYPKKLKKSQGLAFLSLTAFLALIHLFVPIDKLGILTLISKLLCIPYAVLLIGAMIKMAKSRAPLHIDDVITRIGYWILIISQLFEILLKGSEARAEVSGITPAFMLCFVMLLSVSIGIGARRRDRELEESRRKSTVFEQMNLLKNDFLHRLAHEMRTPLTVISGYAQLTEQQLSSGKPDARSIEQLKTISSEAQRLSGLVRNLTDMLAGRCDTPTLKRISINKLVSDIAGICRPMLAKNSNRFVTECPNELFIDGNREILIQLFVNLASNANRHTSNGVIALSVCDEGESIVMRISDTGSGIPPTEAKSIFESGFSLDKGSGIGLSICRDAAKLHGGELILEATGEGGSIFACRLQKKAQNGNSPTLHRMPDTNK